MNKTSIKGHARVKTECNRYALVPVNVVESVEGDIAFSNCSSDPHGCKRIDCCSMVRPWREAQERALSVLGKITFQSLARKERQIIQKGSKS